MREKLPIAPFVLATLLLVSSGLQAQVPLNPQKIPQFVDPLPHFAGLRLDAKAGGAMTIRMAPTQQIAVSTGTKLSGGTVTPGGTVGLANLWAYELSYGGTTKPVHWPAFTIEAQRNNALHVTYVNDLGGETYANVGLVVDQTLHWANPMMDPQALTPYLGEPPAVVHLHGGEVPPLSDGGPDSWFTPGYTKTGHAFNGTPAVGGADGVPAPYFYPNTQEPATIWFHDHALGATRLNVYAGMAGFYLLRGEDEDLLGLPGFADDDLVQEVAPAGASGVFNPDPYLPEIEVAIQDRMFDTNGKLFFPSVGVNPEHPFWVPEFVGDVITVNGKTWPYLSVAPRKYRFHILNGSNARFYNLSFPKGGPTITQIGTDGGFLDNPVPLGNGPLLLAPGERAVVVIDFTAFAKPAGFKGNWKPKTFTLGNDARTPFPGGATVRGNTTGRIMQFVVNGLMVDGTDADGLAGDPSVIPANLRPGQPLVKLTDFAGGQWPGTTVAKKRQLTLNEVMGAAGPLEALVNNTKWNGLSMGTTARPDFEPLAAGGMHDLYFSETIDEGTTEIWQIINLTADAHPIHLHLVQFQLMSRQPFNVAGYTAAYDILFPGGGVDPMTGVAYLPGVFMGGYGPPLDYNAANADGAIGGNPAITPHLIGAPLPANPGERGWKDTFIMYPGEVTTVIARWAPTDRAANIPAENLYFDFDPSGGHGYVWHCHIIDHEDNEMMRPYKVEPNLLAVRSLFPPSVTMARNGVSSKISDEDAPAGPATFELAQNYPNPFNPSTEIRFALPEDARVVLTLYNSLGQEIQRLLDADAPAGNHTVKLDASKLSSGTYFYRIQAGGYTAMKKMTLIK
jgi:spore coat protein A